MTEPSTGDPIADAPEAGVPTTADAAAAAATPIAGAEIAEEDDPRRRRKALLLLFLLGLLAVLLGLAIWYLLFRQALPLPPIPGTEIPHYNTSFNGLDRPVGVGVSAAGDRIYVTQSGADRTAVVLDGNGVKLGSMLPPLSTGPDHAPVYVAVDPLTGEVYVTDRPTASIYIYDREGKYQRQFQPAVERTGWQPLGISFDKAGNLYVTDLGASPQQVVEFDRSGAVVRTVGAEDGLNFPNGVVTDDRGYLYVTDSNNGRLLVYDQAGKLVARIGRGAGAGNLGLPRGVTVDTQGRVFVVDTSGQAVFVYKQVQEGQQKLDYVGLFGTQGVGNGEFMYPNGIAIDGKGRLYVADTSNGRIQLWNY